MDNLRACKTATLLYDEDFSACATCEQKPWISLFFDGTGNNQKIDEPLNKLSNIARLYLGHRDEPYLISRFYYPGVGTPMDASNPSWVDKIRDSEMIGGAMGLGWDARLEMAETDFRNSLKFNHKVKRIDVAVFGFSRGATLARAFVNRLLAKCTFKDNVPHWPCPTAVDGESAPLHFRFLGLFDSVESVGLPAHNLSSMQTEIPEQVDRCLHFVASHELRACFPLAPVRNSAGSHEEIVFPGGHSDVGGGYRPNEQAR
ncbi:T6SS phospholipase effector Tle1-like catalytic domain-containing protein [Pandoraea sp. NPDC090278]|uniref:T6SS phospholipase effector Tle1-like catalytic domain-containing protein n=1 Tax=Pandoraea sp. NPDC090278 TaxID=3364391 RepID=UPI00383A9ABF